LELLERGLLFLNIYQENLKDFRGLCKTQNLTKKHEKQFAKNSLKPSSNIMREKKTAAILLKKTFLANDDGICEFLTSDYGHISIFISKLRNSKKRKAELDFFRILELEFFEGRNSKKLKSVKTVAIFHNFESSFDSLNLGFLWSEKLRKICPEEKPVNDFFREVIDIFSCFDLKFKNEFDVLFRIKCLVFAGIFSSKNTKLSPSTNKTLNFLAKHNIETAIDNFEIIPSQNFSELTVFCNKTEKWHF
jgi:hypothetical protein